MMPLREAQPRAYGYIMRHSRNNGKDAIYLCEKIHETQLLEEKHCEDHSGNLTPYNLSIE